MSNKKFPKLAVLSLLGILALTSCGSDDDDEIESKPSNYDNPIVYVTEGDELSKIQNNINSIIADQFHDELASKTLDKVLYQYAQSIFGSYNKVTLADGDESITLKAAAADLKSNSTTHETADAFIRAHKVYWTYNEKGEHVNDDDPTNPVKVADDKTFAPCQSEYNKVTARFDNIEKRIAENMFSKAKAGGYTEKHFFKEVDYIKALYTNGQDVIHYKTAEADPNVRPLIIDYTVEGEDVFAEEILHREFYQTNFEVSQDETAADAQGRQFHYVEKVVVPEVYGDLLIEQYLLDEESNAVKESRARLINVIKIEKYSDFQINADLLVKQLVKEIYSSKPTGDYLAYVDEDNNPYEAIFEKYQDISKGLTVIDPATVAPVAEGNAHYWDAEQIIKRINDSRSDAFHYRTKQGISYYENTTFGDLVEDYDEFLSAESFDEIDTSLRDKFTSSGSITPEEGFDQEKISLSQVESITKGWYVQKSAPSLDGSGKIKENLFQLSVANAKLEAKDANDTPVLSELAKTDRIWRGKDGTGAWQVRDQAADNRKEGGVAYEGKENKYLCSINGAYFLKFEGNYAGSDYVNDIVYDDGSAYYICQVIEAVKPVKLRNSESTSSYANTRAAGFLEAVTSEVTTKVAETGSYSSLSKEYWLEKMDIKYHDQSVYDYFKSNYPDLFEDED